jgi:hypothetical protein
VTFFFFFFFFFFLYVLANLHAIRVDLGRDIYARMRTYVLYTEYAVMYIEWQCNRDNEDGHDPIAIGQWQQYVTINKW